MKKYDNFCSVLSNMKDTFDYEEPYDNVVHMGLVGLYKICFEQAWRKKHGAVHCRNGTM